MQLVDQLLTCVKDNTNAPGLRDAVLSAGGVSEAFKLHAINIRNDQTLSPIGRTSAIQDAIRSQYSPAFQKAIGPLGTGGATLLDMKAKFIIAPSDPSNIVAAMMASEVRQMVRAMDPIARLSFALGATDERIADAILTAPATLSGLDDHSFDQVSETVLKRRFGPQMAAVDALQDALDAAKAATDVLMNDMRVASGLDERQFSQACGADPVGGISWLLNDGSRVLRVTPGTDGKNTTYRPATPGEISVGKYYAN